MLSVLFTNKPKRSNPMQDEVIIDVRKALSVFELITRTGVKSGEDWTLDQMTANSGFDGYSISLRDQNATLTINFHNTYHVDCDNHQQLKSFVEHLDRLYALDQRKT